MRDIESRVVVSDPDRVRRRLPHTKGRGPERHHRADRAPGRADRADRVRGDHRRPAPTPPPVDATTTATIAIAITVAVPAASHQRRGRGRGREPSGGEPDDLVRWRRGRRSQRGVAIEDRQLELPQARAGLEPELLGQRAPELLVDLRAPRPAGPTGTAPASAAPAAAPAAGVAATRSRSARRRGRAGARGPDPPRRAPPRRSR